MKTKNKGKRSISILTVFLWLALIAVMTVITISGITKNNAIEGEEKLKLKIKVEDVEVTSEMDEFYKNLKPEVRTGTDKLIATFNFFRKDENGVYVYELDINKDELDTAIKNIYNKKAYVCIDRFSIEGKYQHLQVDDKKVTTHYDFFKVSVYVNSPDIEVLEKYINLIDLNINVDIEGLENEEALEQVYSSTVIKPNATIYNTKKYYLKDENGNRVTNINIENMELIDNVKYFGFHINSNVEGHQCFAVLEIDGKEYYSYGDGNIRYVIPEYYLAGEEKKKLNIKVKIIYLPTDTYITQNIKWNKEGAGKAVLELGYTSTGFGCCWSINRGIVALFCPVIYSVRLNEGFELSSEYLSDNEWSILENVNTNETEQGVPKDICYEFFGDKSGIECYRTKKFTGKEYVYVKDTKTIYWMEKEPKVYSGNKKINIVYNKYNDLADNIELNINDESNLCTNGYERYEAKYYQKYNIISPKLRFNHVEKEKIEIEKIVEGEKGTKKYYVGLFVDEKNYKTDKVYMIEVIDGKGSIVIDLPEKTDYYIYEVDGQGNRIYSEEIEYNKNKVTFNSYVRDTNIETDKNILSSVMSGRYDENVLYTDEDYIYCSETNISDSIGTGEKDYIDNVLNVTDTYQEKVIISSKVKKYTVRYEAESGGKIFGEKEEIVNLGEKPQNVPTPVANEGYEFVRWEVEKDGKRIEVMPSKYVIEKDTIFYAVFEKIPVEVDTNDINIGIYVIVFLIAIIGIFGLIIFSFKIKKKEVK